jgi:hypothetical protein
MDKHAGDIPFNRSALKLCMGKLVTVAAETTVAARVLATFATALDAPICCFKASCPRAQAYPSRPVHLIVGMSPGEVGIAAMTQW